MPRKKGARGVKPKWLYFECDVCHIKFDGSYRKYRHKLKQSRQYCKARCFYDDLAAKERPRTGVDVPCLYCGAPVYATPCVMKKKRIFCKGGKCGRKYFSEHYDEYPQNHKNLFAPDVRKRATETRSKRWKSGELKHHRLGKKHSKKAKQKISKACSARGGHTGKKNPMFGRKHTDRAREKMSETKTRKILAGEYKNKTRHVTGYYTSIKAGLTYWHRSSWELKMMQFLDTCDDVLTYEYESVRFTYIDSANKKRWYVPDFIVSYNDGCKKMYELKPKEFVNNKVTKLKASAATEYCKINRISEYAILTRDELKDMGVL